MKPQRGIQGPFQRPLPQAPAVSRLDVTIQTASADTPSGELTEILHGRDWLDTGRFPTARFERTAIAAKDSRPGTVTGNLSLRGIRKPTALAVALRGGAYNMLTGALTLGFKGIRMPSGTRSPASAVANEVALENHAGFRRIDG